MITINNEKLSEFLVTILGKSLDRIEYSDLDNINVINISNVNPYTQKREFILDELKKFKSLKKVIISSSIIENEDIEVLCSLEKIHAVEFINCIIKESDEISKMNKMHSLTFNRCYLKDFSFLKKMVGLKKLEIIFPYEIKIFNIRDLKEIKNIEKLTLAGFIIENTSELDDLRKIKYLSFLECELRQLTFIKNLNDNTELFLPFEYLKYNEVVDNANRLIIRCNYNDYLYDEEDVIDKSK